MAKKTAGKSAGVLAALPASKNAPRGVEAVTVKGLGRVTREHAVKPPVKGSLAGIKGSAGKRAVRTMAVPGTKSYPTTMFRGNVADVIEHLRSGRVGGAIIPDLASRVGVTQERLLDELRLPKSTLKVRIAKNADLSAAERDRIYRVEKVLERANAVLEDAAAAQAWISSSIRSLGGVSPLSLLDTEAGYELVLDTLGRIEYGVIS
jgi:putative toxin-antitoxin system antitoxin component (TIGR02293 family)